MRVILALIVFFNISFSSIVNPETGWEYVQSTLQAFYMFNDDFIYEGDGCSYEQSSNDVNCYCLDSPDTCDVIGAFYNDVCIGWIYADNEGWTTVPAMGASFGSTGTPGSENYAVEGSLITFKLYDASSGIEYPIIDPICQSNNGDCSWSSNVINIFEGPFTLDNESSQTPINFGLLKAYPNPFNPSVNIDFSIESLSLVNIKVYDLLGSVVKDLILDEMMAPGVHSINWHPTNDISSGEYIIKMTVDDASISTYKVLYIK